MTTDALNIIQTALDDIDESILDSHGVLRLEVSTTVDDERAVISAYYGEGGDCADTDALWDAVNSVIKGAGYDAEHVDSGAMGSGIRNGMQYDGSEFVQYELSAGPGLYRVTARVGDKDVSSLEILGEAHGVCYLTRSDADEWAEYSREEMADLADEDPTRFGDITIAVESV